MHDVVSGVCGLVCSTLCGLGWSVCLECVWNIHERGEVRGFYIAFTWAFLHLAHHQPHIFMFDYHDSMHHESQTVCGGVYHPAVAPETLGQTRHRARKGHRPTRPFARLLCLSM